MVTRRIFEASSRTLPWLAGLFVPIALGMHHLYPWSHADHVAHDPALQHKALYLNTPFFLIRAVIYFAVWIGASWYLNRLSAAQDRGDATATVRMQRFSGAGLIVYALTITFA